MNTFFTSDHHFDHENIISLCNRPFSSIEEMNETFIERWNDIVRPISTIYYHGDLSLGNSVYHIIPRLNGRIKFLHLPFHHDGHWQPTKCYTSLRMGKQEVSFLPPEHTLVIDGYHIHLSHFPIASWNRKHHGGWHLHGHSHGKHKAEGKILDVGVDTELAQFAPIPFEVIREYMEGR